jgi:RHS repeat-associated protein
MSFLRACISLSLCLAVVAAPAIPAFADDYVVGGGDSPAPVDDPDDPDAPPCDDAPKDECAEAGESPELNSGDTKKCSTGEPIALHSGAFYYRHTDLAIPGRIPMVIRRAYDTRSTFNGVMGYGWSFNYHLRLFPLDDGNLIVKRGDNSKDVFTANGDGTYASPADQNESVTFNPDGTYTLVKKSGHRYEFDINGRLMEIANRRNNQLLFEYDVAGLLPVNGISPFASSATPILIGFDYRLTRINEAQADVQTGRYIDLTYNDDGRVSLIQDFTGRQVTYTYDISGTGDLLSISDPMQNAYDYTYDADHRMMTFVGGGCSDCSLHSNVYDSQGRCTQQKHGSLVIDVDYLVPGGRTKVTTWIYDDDSPDPDNPILLNTRYEYYDFDDAGRTILFSRQLGDEFDADPESTEDDDVVTAYEYDPISGAVVLMTDPRGVTTTYQYDVLGNLTQELIIAPDDPAQWWMKVYEYNDANAPYQYSSIEVTASFDPLSHRTEFTYFPDGKLKNAIQFPDDVTSYTTSFTYTTAGELATREDPRGNVLAYEYDTYGFLKREYDPSNLEHQVAYEYEAIGKPKSFTDALGRVTSPEYDVLGRLSLLTNALDEQGASTYEGPNLTEVEIGRTESQAGRRTRMTYDALNRRKTVEVLEDAGVWVVQSTTSYDSEGRISRQVNGNGNATRFVRDVLGRTVAACDALTNTTAYSFDKGGNLVATIDAEGKETRTDYDFLGRVSYFHYGDTYQIRYAHDALGNIVEVEDANLRSTYFHRDRMSRMTKLEDANGNNTAYEYDGNGNLVSKITPNENAGQQRPIVYEYNDYNWLGSVRYPEGNKIVNYTYDLVGNRSSWDDGKYSEDSVLDVLDRLKARIFHFPDFSKTVSYTHMPTGEVKSVTDGEQLATFYHRNSLGRLRFISHPGNLITEYRYDVGGRLSERVLPNGVAATQQHDDADRLTSLVYAGPMGTLASFDYSYDDVGNRKSLTTLAGVHYYDYTDVYQLSSASHPEPELVDESYTYDGVQNRLTSAEHDDYVYDENNFLLGYGPHTFTPDAAGNLINKTGPEGATTYTYDDDNYLIGVTTPDHTIEFEYTPSGRRISKTVDGEVTFYHYDGPNVIGEYDPTGVIHVSFLHGRLIDEPIALVEGAEFYVSGDFDHNGIVNLVDYLFFQKHALGHGNGEGILADLDGDGDGDLRDFAIMQDSFGDAGAPSNIQYYLQDGIRSTVALTASDGSITETYNYGAFGQHYGVGVESANPFLFTARRFDRETNLYYFRTRYWDIQLGWFTSIDRIGSWGDLGNYGNGYAYVGNRPNMYTDPFGLEFNWCLDLCELAACVPGGVIAATVGIGVCAGTATAGCVGAAVAVAAACKACLYYCEYVVCAPSDPPTSGGGATGEWGSDPVVTPVPPPSIYAPHPGVGSGNGGIPTPTPTPAPVPLPTPTPWAY